MREALQAWTETQAATLEDGAHTMSLSSLPFSFDVVKSSERQPGVFFARYAPLDASLPERLREQVNRKAAKLRPYRDDGKTTVVLLESSDIALMNESILVEALKQALPGGLPDGIAQIWFADTSIPEAPHEFANLTDFFQTFQGAHAHG